MERHRHRHVYVVHDVVPARNDVGIDICNIVNDVVYGGNDVVIDM